MVPNETSTPEKILIIGNFSISIYFLIIYLISYFEFYNAVINFLHELLSITFLLAAIIFFILSILRFIQHKPRPLFILSFIILTITNILIAYSFLTYG